MSPQAATPYVVRGILDPGLNNMAAFGLKIPHGWQLMQSFTRKWNGAQPVNQMLLRLLGPGGQQQIDFLPERPYYCQDGPASRSLRQQAASMGIAMPRHVEYGLPPMPALAYIKQVPSHATGPTASAYVDGRLPNGRAVRVECQVNPQVTNASGEQYGNRTALPSVTQTTGDLNPVLPTDSAQVVQHQSCLAATGPIAGAQWPGGQQPHNPAGCRRLPCLPAASNTAV